MSLNRRAAAFAAALAALALAAAALAPSPALAQRAPLRLHSVPEPAGKPVDISKALMQRERDAVARGGPGRDVSVIVRLEGEALSSYRGSIAGLPATAPRAVGAKRLNPRSANSQRYLAHLNARQQAFAARLPGAVPAARVLHRYQAALNGMNIVLPESRISALAALPGVAGVYEDRLLSVTTEVSPAFIGAPALWGKLGGQDRAGEGVIIGVLDSGVWPEHPSLSDPDPGGKPYAPPPGPARGCEFGIGARPGPAFACNNKLIGARRFMSTYDSVVGLLPTEYTSARDDNGHGSHTATTAGGNRAVSASILERDFGIVSGIAPRAQVVAYKVCGSQGCFASDSVAAVNQAILDGVDVINFSISGGGSPYTDAVSLAFLDAYEAGVFVAASAGNAGPAPNSVDHREPWTTTVAASTSSRQFQSALTLRAQSGAQLSLLGASITPALPVPAPVVVPTDGGCAAPFAPGSVAGKVVVCIRGGNTRPEKSFNVRQGGAVGMILYNLSRLGVASDNHFVPTVHLENDQGADLLAFLAAQTGVTATLTAGSEAASAGDVMANFSSRGGPDVSTGISKPDVTAPGVQILAGTTATPATAAGGPPGQLFQAIQGTSMSSPHVAGAAALVRALHPDWTPGQVKSALMTTALSNVRKEDGATPADAFDMGSGRIDLNRAGDPGLLFDETGANFVALQSSLWSANYPSLYVPTFLGQIAVERTVQNTRNEARAWKLAVIGPADLKVNVPKTIAVPALGSATFRIEVDGRGIEPGGTRKAVLELSRPNEATLRFPITVVRGAAPVPLTKSCMPTVLAQHANLQCTITLTNTTFTPASVTLVDRLPNNQLQLVGGSVVNAGEAGNGLRFDGVLAPAQPPGIAIAPGDSLGYAPLRGFGISPIGGFGDESIVNLDVPAFRYAGEVYTRVGVVSNGYLVVGGGSGSDVNFTNQSLPDAARPNNVLAPFWTDLDPGAAGELRAGVLTDGVRNWLALEWEGVREFSSPKRATFQVWIGLNDVEDITYAYGPLESSGDGGLLTVGAENRFGNRGAMYYFNGAGTLPAASTDLQVTSTPGAAGETRTITFSARAKNKGPWTNCAEMTSNVYFGTQTACVSGSVTK